MIKDFHFGGTIHLFVYILDFKTTKVDRKFSRLIEFFNYIIIIEEEHSLP